VESPSRKRNKYDLEPFFAVDTASANYLLGRTDVPPDPDEGQTQAALDAVRGIDPEIDVNLPWGLLMGGMFSLLYKEDRKKNKTAQPQRRMGFSSPEYQLPRPIRVSPHDWAEAFNIITVRYIQTDYFLRPQKIKETKLTNGRTVALQLLLTKPGKGIAKSIDYYKNRLPEMKAKLRRMEFHRQNVADDSRVQKYLQTLRMPKVS